MICEDDLHCHISLLVGEKTSSRKLSKTNTFHIQYFIGTDLLCVATCERCPGESVEDDVIG